MSRSIAIDRSLNARAIARASVHSESSPSLRYFSIEGVCSQHVTRCVKPKSFVRRKTRKSPARHFAAFPTKHTYLHFLHAYYADDKLVIFQLAGHHGIANAKRTLQ